jgi:hypothetical protein
MTVAIHCNVNKGYPIEASRNRATMSGQSQRSVNRSGDRVYEQELVLQ